MCLKCYIWIYKMEWLFGYYSAINNMIIFDDFSNKIEISKLLL